MGPYYRNTSQATGAFFDMFYQYPILIALLIAAVVGVLVYLLRK